MNRNWLPRPALPAILLAVLLGGLAAADADPLADAAGLPKLVRTNQRTFAIPFRLPDSRDPDADATPQRVLLNVSRDLGATWASAGETAPTAGSFSYTADVDGEYWFRLRTIDRKGRSRGGEGPDIRVLVDAAGPRLAARVWKGADGEIICRYAAADDSLRLDSLVLEYRGGQEKGWKNVAADAVLAREHPAHMVGETIWWAGERVEQLVVRISITDSSGNQAVKQFSLEPADPGIDQSALASELGLPPLPASEAPAYAAPPGGVAPTASVIARRDAGSPWRAEPARWSDSLPAPRGAATTGTADPPADAASQTSRDRSSAPGTEPSGDPPRRRPATAAGLLPRAGGDAGRQAGELAATADPLAAAGITRPTAAGEPMIYRGRPLHLVNARRFAWDYEVPAVRRTAGRLRAELWTTRDGGLTWQRAAVDKECRSPIAVELPQTGFYGVRLELVADVPDAEGGPRSGAEPDAWVGVDEEPPQVELAAVDRDEAAAGDVLVIRYAARDPLLPADAVRLSYSPNPDGPWATIAAGLANEGSHRWEPSRNVPARVFIRIEATDAAGNQGAGATEEAVSIAPTRFHGRLGGLRPLPAP